MDLLLRVKGLDLMAPPIMLSFNKGRGVKTIFGVIMTIGYALATVALSVVIFLTYLDTSAPQVMEQNYEDSNYPRADLGKSGLLPVLYTFANLSGSVPPDQIYRYFTPVFVRTKISYSSTGELQNTNTVLNLVSCDKVLKDEKASKYYKVHQETNPTFNMTAANNLCVWADD